MEPGSGFGGGLDGDDVVNTGVDFMNEFKRWRYNGISVFRRFKSATQAVSELIKLLKDAIVIIHIEFSSHSNPEFKVMYHSLEKYREKVVGIVETYTKELHGVKYNAHIAKKQIKFSHSNLHTSDDKIKSLEKDVESLNNLIYGFKLKSDHCQKIVEKTRDAILKKIRKSRGPDMRTLSATDITNEIEDYERVYNENQIYKKNIEDMSAQLREALMEISALQKELNAYAEEHAQNTHPPKYPPPPPPNPPGFSSWGGPNAWSSRPDMSHERQVIEPRAQCYQNLDSHMLCTDAFQSNHFFVRAAMRCYGSRTEKLATLGRARMKRH